MSGPSAFSDPPLDGEGKRGLIERYRAWLPLPPNAPNLSLGEGSTPLVPLQNLELPGGNRVPDSIDIYAKVEGANPTGSFKDRGMVVAISKAQGARCVICASTGNTSASAAAYAARAGMACIVLIPKGMVAAGKIAQAVAHGAHIVQIDGNFDDAMTAVKQRADQGNAAVVNSINPYRLQGQKTAALEIISELGRAPDYHALPVGNAGNITAHWIGYCEAAGESTPACSRCGGDGCDFLKCAGMPANLKKPMMLGGQAAGAASFERGGKVENPETVATAIRIGKPQSYEAACIALQESGGWIRSLPDEAILDAQRQLARREGIFCEPASAAGLACALAEIAEGKIQEGAVIACTLTGHGLKDPDIVEKKFSKSWRESAADSDALGRAIDSIIKEHAG